MGKSLAKDFAGHGKIQIRQFLKSQLVEKHVYVDQRFMLGGMQLLSL